jgi:integration host factor subunit beta
MIRSELVRRIASANTHLYEREVENVVGTVFEEITNAMVRGDRVELRGFGVFSTRVRQTGTARNPRTGAIVPVRHKALAFFRAGKEMHRRLNPVPTNPPSTSK